MNMLGHENISRNDESVASANRLKLALEGLVSRALAKQRQPSITAESYEMKVPGFLITNKALGHGIEFYTGGHRLGVCAYPPLR